MIEIAESFLTEEYIVRIYEYLTLSRIKEITGWNANMCEGQRDGYLCCLEDLFGVTDDETMERAAIEQKSIVHVVDRIVKYMQSEIQPFVQRSVNDISNYTANEIKELVKIVKDKTREYAINNFNDCLDGIRNL